MTVLRHNRTFFISYLIFLLIGLYLVRITTRPELFLMLNFYHTAPLDQFFASYTHIGLPYFSVFLLGICDKYKLNPNRIGAGYYILGGLILMFLIFLTKEYYQQPRPMSYPLIRAYYHQIVGTPLLTGNHSFPSGHTATIFFTVTSYLMINKYPPIIQFGFLLLAVTVGYSRIYVGAHFLEDVLAGSYLGMMIPVILYSFFHRRLDAIFK